MTTSDEDDRHSKGQAAISDSTDDDIHAASWKALFSFTTKSHLTCLAIALSATLATGGIAPAQSYLTGQAFNAFTTSSSTSNPLERISKYALYMVAIGLGSWLIHFIMSSAWFAFGELQANSARNRLYLAMLEKEIGWYDMRKNGIGAMIPRLQAQIRDLQLSTAQPLGAIIAGIADGIASLGFALYTSWKLTLVILSIAPLIMLVLGYLSSRMQRYIVKQQEKLMEALKYVSNAINGIETVKCFNGQQHELLQYTTRLREAAEWYYRLANSSAQQFGFMGFLSSGMFVAGFYYGGVLVRSGEKTTANIITTFVSATSAFQSLTGIVPQLIVLEKGKTAGATLKAIMEQIEKPSTTTLPHRNLRPDQCDGEILFEDVSFAYPTRPSRLALKNVTLTVPARATTFIIGKSGSGKSTFGQLLLRFYSPTQGQILFDGHPLASLDPTWLRSHVTFVEQHSTLFEDTVSENIAAGNRKPEGVSQEDVANAVEFALLQSMVSDMPEGLRTMVGAKGGTMSGGQRQRMALARAYLRDTPVLILDESTSALDQVSRSLMMDAIRRWRHGKTTMIITHDISQILPNDYAIVLEDGQLAQRGSRKDMEQTPQSPFQKFLKPKLESESSSSDITHSPVLHLPEIDAGDKMEHQSSGFDPLETYLAASETPRYSYLPALFSNHDSKAAFGGAYGFSTPLSKFGVSLTPFSSDLASPTTRQSSGSSPPNSLHLKAGEHSLGSGQTAAANSRPTKRKSYVPDLMEKFLETTGNLAARARLTSGSPRRRRLLSDSSAIAVAEDIEMTSSFKRTRANFFDVTKSNGTRTMFSLKSILATVWPSLNWVMRAVLVLGFLFSAISAACTPVFSNILSKLLATYGKEDQEHQAVVYTFAILGISCATALSNYASHILMEFAGQVWINELRERALERVLCQPRDFFFLEENSVSLILEGLDRQAEEMRNILGRFVLALFSAIVLTLVALIWAMISQWKLTLIALSLSPYIWLGTKGLSIVSDKWESKSNNAAEIIGAIYTETFTNIKTVRALTLEDRFRSRYLKATTDTLQLGFRRSVYVGFFNGLSDSSLIFVSALLFYSGAKLLSEGANVAKVTEVFIQLTIAMSNVGLYLNMIPQMSLSKSAASRLLRLSVLPKDSHERLGNTQIMSVGDIEFHNLNFSYPSRPDQKVLSNINLLIPSGQITAIVGTSGSGKSTIAALLLGLYSTTNRLDSTADITLAGRDIKHTHTPSLRSLITVVSQNPVLFPTTIADNITYGLPEHSVHKNFASVRRAAAAAGIDEFIMSLPQGYDTLVGENGTGLSGGQAQRVAIARALVRRPAVMILDEATSALDVESSNLVRDTIQGLVKHDKTGMTIIIITHNKEMMQIAQNIVMLSGGKIVEHGSYEDLLRKKGEFASMLSGGEWGADIHRRGGFENE